jgi:hypothetical protein
VLEKSFRVYENSNASAKISKHNRNAEFAFFLPQCHRNSFVSDAASCYTFDGITAISRQSERVSIFQILLNIRHFGKKCHRKILSTDFCIIKLFR